MATVTLKEQDRIIGIENLQPTEEGKFINYNNENKLYFVYEIPLKFLIYNAHNGRIRSLTKSFKAQYHELNPELEDDKLIIEQFLYDSAKAKNNRTIDSIRKNGQQEVGIVTKDGVIIDGNRRAMILNMINSNFDENRKFKAIILPDKLADNPKEIITLETSYQMGVDSKVDYNPIEKYIRCEELEEFGYSLDDIAVQMGETEKQIREWLEILKLMEEYLRFLGTPKTYTRLEKREGHFVDLFKYLKSFEGKTVHQSMDWSYSSSDIEDMKHAYFTYIRLGIPVARARVIARPASTNSFFCHKNIWEDFKKEYTYVTSSVNEVDFDTVQSQHTTENKAVLIEKVDTNWKNLVEDSLEDVLSYYEGLLTDALNTFVPLRLLKRAKSTLSQIDKKVLKNEMDEEKQNLIYDLDEIIQSFKNL